MGTKQENLLMLYFTSTHWDREWYLTFQEFRARLVDVMQEALSVLERDSSFRAFITDGQTVMLEDYLEAVPGDRKRVETLLREGRLLSGPWYTMPDENLVSGESLIQNLRLGHRCAQELGAENALPLGYICDIFGHVAQMPQIFNGFGITSAVLGRGTNDHLTPSFFNWEAPSGHSCATYKVPESCGYGTFWYDVFFKAGADASFEKLFALACEYVDRELARSPLPFVVMVDGMDHTKIHPEAPHLVKALEEKYGAKILLGQPQPFFRELEKRKGEMPMMRGELQQPAKSMAEHNKLISGTLSSRYDIKYANDAVQTLLEKQALPLAGLAAAQGTPVKADFESIAYRYLLKNHAHDSICGCSIDEVHDDMLYRFRQANLAAKELRDAAVCELICLEEQEGAPTRLVLVNPLPFGLDREVTADISFPCNYPCRFDEFIPSEAVNQFELIGKDGTPVPYAITGIKRNVTVRKPKEFYGRTVDQYTVCFHAEIPAMGSAAYEIRPSELPVRYFDTLRTGELCAENQFLRLEIQNDGRVCLTDKTNGQKIGNLISYLDSSETGDGWYSRQCVPDRVVHSAAAASVETVLDGPDCCCFCVTHLMRVPQKVVYDRRFTARDTACRELCVKTYLTLSRHTAGLEIVTEVNNNCLDHRLKLKIATNLPTKTYHADQAFAFVERDCGRDPETEQWKEPDKTEKAFGHVAYRQGQNGSGVAVLSKGGLHEMAACTDEAGSFEITLMRCFSKTFLTAGQSAGQLSGNQRFSVTVMPFAGDAPQVALLNARDAFAVPPLAYTLSCGAAPLFNGKGYQLEQNQVYVSVIKPSVKKGSVLVRLVNYQNTPVSDCILSGLAVKSACVCDLLENEQQTLQTEGNRVAVSLSPYELLTVLIQH